MDERGRQLERLAASGDQAALDKLRHFRCQIGECCAHGTGLPMPAPEALDCYVIIEETSVDLREPEVADIHLRLVGEGKALVSLMDWFRKLDTGAPSMKKLSEL